MCSNWQCFIRVRRFRQNDDRSQVREFARISNVNNTLRGCEFREF